MESTPPPADDAMDSATTLPEIPVESPTAKDMPMLFGRYRVVRELGSGGMGRVVLALDTRLEIRVAVKILPAKVAGDPEAVNRLKKEVLRGMALMHPGIARTHNFEQDDQGAGIVMEFVDGPTLGALKTGQVEGCFAPDEIEEWIGQLCTVLDYAHQDARIVHRDLKPNNILVTAPEAGSVRGRTKVADFGLATTLNSSAARHSQEGVTSGTPPYMSPQQARGERPSHLDDIYALGATIYDLLTGTPPFYHGNITLQIEQVVPPPMAQRRVERGIVGQEAIPPTWEKTVAACLAKNPADRPQSAGEVWRRLRQSEAETLPGRATSGPPTRHPSRSSGLSHRRWWALALIAGALLASAVAFHRHHTNRGAPPQSTPSPGSVVSPRELIAAASVGVPFVNGLGMKFVPVPISGAGAKADSSASPKILFATTQTTVEQYGRFIASTGRPWPKPDFAQASDHPAVNVTWDDAVAFCAWLTEIELAAKRLPPGSRYRLPTDHEWSCAVGIGDRENPAQSPKVKRGAIDGVYPWGTQWPPPKGSGNYSDETAKKAGIGAVHIDGYDDGFAHTCPVEAFSANALGIRGLGGNASEWCEDWYDPEKKEERTLRGGSWADGDELYLRSSFRGSAEPGERFAGYGFRCVLEPAR